MINKVTNTHCRSKIIFFLLTLYKSLKTFLSGTSNAIFFSLLPFSTVIGEEAENGLWGAPCLQDDHQVLPFYVKMLHFFLSSWVFIQDKSEANTFDAKHPEELKSKSLPWQDSRWVPSLASTLVLWMSSSRKPACTETRVAYWRWASKVF